MNYPIINTKTTEAYMTKSEVNHFIETILSQQATIKQQEEKIKFLQILVDNLTRELEMCRREGKL